VEGGLRLKRAGNALVARIGGRAIHPVSVRVGGFSRVIRRDEIRSLRTDLVEALDLAEATIELVADLRPPAFRRDARLVALRDAAAYPMNHGRIVSNDGPRYPRDSLGDDVRGAAGGVVARAPGHGARWAAVSAGSIVARDPRWRPAASAGRSGDGAPRSRRSDRP
jgi:hypothetical protein